MSAFLTQKRVLVFRTSDLHSVLNCLWLKYNKERGGFFFVIREEFVLLLNDFPVCLFYYLFYNKKVVERHPENYEFNLRSLCFCD